MGSKNLIESIHASSLFGIIVECGSGSVISNALYEVSGASNTIYESKQPYSKEIQVKNYGTNYQRSISREFVEQVLITEFIEAPNSCNFILATSFQLSDLNSTQLAHGWIGLAVSEQNSHCLGELTKWIKTRYSFHFSFNFNGSRKDYLYGIQKIGIEILYHYSSNTLEQFNSQYLDIFNLEFDSNEYIPKNDIKSTLLHGLFNVDNKTDNFITIAPNGIIRFEDFVRGKEGIILQKGTYNPIHVGHLEIMNLSQKQYPSYASAFLISIDKYDKASVQLDDLLKLVESITKLGYTVIICKKPLFKDSLNWIRNRWYNLPIIFPVGVDTINRIARAEVEEYYEKSMLLSHLIFLRNKLKRIYFNTKFLIFIRNGFELIKEVLMLESIIEYNEEYTDPMAISSSKIRNGEIENNL